MYADVCLHALVERNLGDKISLGGAFGLLHYLDYRPTFDVDAWWTENASTRDKEQVVDAIMAALIVYGQVRRRAFGDVISIELETADKKKTFSFQIAERSAQLLPSILAPWTAVLLDSLSDLIASKMNALIQRGAPRDFRDIYAACQSQLTTPQECWQLWQQRQQLAGDDADLEQAKTAINGHLERIELYRPLAQINNAEQQQQAAQVRRWYREVFNDVEMD
ncbi:MAG: hypothetical protein EOM24_30590 [Chloroflexia bacterium]|nr:hypothetical protein [Chloroflexia bacterium]